MSLHSDDERVIGFYASTLIPLFVASHAVEIYNLIESAQSGLLSESYAGIVFLLMTPLFFVATSLMVLNKNEDSFKEIFGISSDDQRKVFSRLVLKNSLWFPLYFWYIHSDPKNKNHLISIRKDATKTHDYLEEANKFGFIPKDLFLQYGGSAAKIAKENLDAVACTSLLFWCLTSFFFFVNTAGIIKETKQILYGQVVALVINFSYIAIAGHGLMLLFSWNRVEARNILPKAAMFGVMADVTFIFVVDMDKWGDINTGTLNIVVLIRFSVFGLFTLFLLIVALKAGDGLSCIIAVCLGAFFTLATFLPTFMAVTILVMSTHLYNRRFTTLETFCRGLRWHHIGRTLAILDETIHGDRIKERSRPQLLIYTSDLKLDEVQGPKFIRFAEFYMQLISYLQITVTVGLVWWTYHLFTLVIASPTKMTSTPGFVALFWTMWIPMTVSTVFTVFLSIKWSIMVHRDALEIDWKATMRRPGKSE